MLRRLKAWYLMIAFGVLWIGGGIFGYLQLLAPALQINATKATAYTTACNDANTSYQKATDSFKAYPGDAQNYLSKHQLFHNIQNTMPDLYDMQSVYGADAGGGSLTPKQRTGLQLLYQWMQHGKYIGELQRWAKGYKKVSPQLQTASAFANFDGLLGYEDTFTNVHLVQVDFGPQTLTAYGYGDLLNKLQKQYGYAHFPLIIVGPDGSVNGSVAKKPATPAAGNLPPTGGRPPAHPAAMFGADIAANPPGGPPSKAPGGPPVNAGPSAGAPHAPGPPSDGGAAPSGGGGGGNGSFGSLSITVDDKDKHGNSKKPALNVSYQATGFFFLKGWDPDKDAVQHTQDAQSHLLSGPTLPQPAPFETPPLVMGFFNAITVPQVGPPTTGMAAPGAPAAAGRPLGAPAAGQPPMPMGRPPMPPGGAGGPGGHK